VAKEGNSAYFNLVSTISLEDRRRVSKDIVSTDIPKGTT